MRASFINKQYSDKVCQIVNQTERHSFIRVQFAFEDTVLMSDCTLCIWYELKYKFHPIDPYVEGEVLVPIVICVHPRERHKLAQRLQNIIGIVDDCAKIRLQNVEIGAQIRTKERLQMAIREFSEVRQYPQKPHWEALVAFRAERLEEVAGPVAARGVRDWHECAALHRPGERVPAIHRVRVALLIVMFSLNNKYQTSLNLNYYSTAT